MKINQHIQVGGRSQLSLGLLILNYLMEHLTKHMMGCLQVCMVDYLEMHYAQDGHEVAWCFCRKKSCRKERSLRGSCGKCGHETKSCYQEKKKEKRCAKSWLFKELISKEKKLKRKMMI